MKRWLSLLLALMFAFSACALAEPADATAIDSSIGNQLGLDVLHQLYLYDQQALFSPVSLTYALAMAAAGARGGTLDELLATLDIDELSLDALGIAADSLNVRGAKSANAAFVSSDIALQDAYLGSLRGALDAGIFSFSQLENAKDEINAWAREKTDGMVDPLLADSLESNLLLMLANAMALDAKWRVPFDEDATQAGTFDAPHGAVDVEYMRATRQMPYLQGETFQAVYLPYAQESLGMVVILPEAGRMYDTLDLLAANGLDLLDDMQNETVALALPKLKMSASMDLTDALQSLGLEKPFSAEADFSGMAEEGGLFISSVRQSAYLEVNEQGTRAAAATVVAMAGSALETEPPVDMTVNRPYILLVYDAETNSILFAAVVSDPSIEPAAPAATPAP